MSGQGARERFVEAMRGLDKAIPQGQPIGTFKAIDEAKRRIVESFALAQCEIRCFEECFEKHLAVETAALLKECGL